MEAGLKRQIRRSHFCDARMNEMDTTMRLDLKYPTSSPGRKIWFKISLSLKLKNVQNSDNLNNALNNAQT